MTKALPPRPTVDNAPGLTWRPMGNGWEARWRPRTDLVQRGYPPRPYRLWHGTELTEAERLYLSDACTRMQGEMLAWAHGADAVTAAYSGTIRSLAECYQTDQDSPYHTKRYRTRLNYDSMLKRIIADRGSHPIAGGFDPDGNPIDAIKARTLLRWHEEWSKRGIPMAHGLMTMLRMLFGFGASFLEDDECERLCTIMSRMKFPQGGHREVAITAEQATAVRAKAHEMGHHAMALAQAFQFECTLRQKDVIGEWVPVSEAGTSEILRGEDKWLRGLRWSEIDQNMILTHITSKRNKKVEINLRLAPMVLEELKLAFGLNLADELTRSKFPASGPIIIDEFTGLPYTNVRFRAKWREVARAAGIPDNVCNMDSRAGAISEATASGATLEDARHAATHSNVSTTQIYSRESAERVAKVMTLRVAGRKNKPGT